MTQATNDALGTIVLGGDLLCDDASNPQLRPTGVTPGAKVVSKIHVDRRGLITYDGESNVLDLVFSDATTEAAGLVMVCAGLDVTAGVISLDAPDATTSTKGFVQLGDKMIAPGGVMTVQDATNDVKGFVRIGSGIDVVAGVISMVVGSDTVAGILQAGDGLSVAAGVVSADLAAGTTAFGVVKSNNTNNITIAGGAIDVGSNVVKKDAANTFTKAQVAQLATNTFNASLTPDFTDSNVVEVVLTGNVTALNVPVGTVDGGLYTLILQQDATGSRTLSGINSAYKTNQTITLSTGVNKRDVITLVRESSTKFYVLFAAGY